MTPVVLFRKALSSEEEFRRSCLFLKTVTARTDVPKHSLVIPRYSALPYYNELAVDVSARDSQLINDEKQFNWIANFHYYDDLSDLTFQTWTDADFYRAVEGPYIVKGRTNSRKHQWNKLFYADSKHRAMEIADELSNDPLIGPQGIIYRQYVPLKTFERCPIYGTPFANEWRLFYYKQTRLATGYYWSNASEATIERASIGNDGLAFADVVASRVAPHNNFYVMDIAEKEDGGWVLVELNSGEMSGTSCIDPFVLYQNLGEALGLKY